MTTNPQVVSGLTNGTLYQVQTRANNSAGNGAWSPSASATPSSVTNLITNGDFSGGTTGWTGFGFSGKSVSGGKAVFASTPAFDGIAQNLVPVDTKYYELTYTLVASAGNVIPRFVGGANPAYTTQSVSGTYVQRIAAGASITQFQFLPGAIFSGTIDDVSLTGPYNTVTVGGA
jgi:hypothetical protein